MGTPQSKPSKATLRQKKQNCVVNIYFQWHTLPPNTSPLRIGRLMPKKKAGSSLKIQLLGCIYLWLLIVDDYSTTQFYDVMWWGFHKLLPFLKLTVRTWIWMVGIRSFLSGRPIFQGRTVSFRECINKEIWKGFYKPLIDGCRRIPSSSQPASDYSMFFFVGFNAPKHRPLKLTVPGASNIAGWKMDPLKMYCISY